MTVAPTAVMLLNSDVGGRGYGSGMASRADLDRALREGRRVEPLTPNPYYGLGALAVAWRRGYSQNIRSRNNQTEQTVAYYRARAHLN